MGCPVYLFSRFAFSVPLRLCGKPSLMTFQQEGLNHRVSEAQRRKAEVCSSVAITRSDDGDFEDHEKLVAVVNGLSISTTFR